MQQKRQLRLVFLFLTLLTLLLIAGCGSSTQSYSESFDEVGNWRAAGDANVSGTVKNGVYDFNVIADRLAFWTTAGVEYGNGRYEVEAKQVDGPVDNGYGLIFRVDDENDDFYSFQISGDGYVWIGRYRDGGSEEAEAMVNDWWFESDAVNQGLDVVNKLGVEAEDQNMIFYVNDQEVGRVTDDAFASGDIGLLVRTLGVGGVHVEFDNFTITPIGTTN